MLNKSTLYFFCLSILISFCSFSKEYHVAKNGSDSNEGSSGRPVQTISAAVKLAYPGDTITVHTGTYREWVNPLRGGNSDSNRIVYRAALGEKVQIKGSEVVTGWKRVQNGVWKVILPNSFFGDYNPYKDSINGDWFIDRGRLHHTGEVFFNGKSLFEKETLAKVLNPVAMQEIKDVQSSLSTWYCESDEKNTTIWANFQGEDPNKALVEITTRRTCFYPQKPGINYITISGFSISQAATQWAAPTAEQVGMVATHWNKGWIIENNIISDSKCNGITLGKERSTGHNVWTTDKENVNRDGNIHYIEVIFNVVRNNWNKEMIGSHIVRNNRIFNCEQTGICGSMGAVFSTIENNHIYNIWVKRQFDGAEISGIKFHAPIDVTIRKNKIHDSARGIWLDWMTQGTRVSRNLFYNNAKQDLWLEVNHGPYIVDNNIFLSSEAINNQSDGGAYIHNLIQGVVVVRPDLNRFTPYFLPHSIDVKGLTTIFGGDDRVYNNLFIGNDKPERTHGLEAYNTAKLPVWIENNVYCNHAKPSLKDLMPGNYSAYNPDIKLVELGDETFLHITFDQELSSQKGKMITTDLLGKAKVSKALFENPDGTVLAIDTDYFGNSRTADKIFAGPFANVKPGKVVLKVW
ncbi:right-handed parallel beta-helix repeat-containing protein [Dyadobacter diqingensis]|uniref:right-handed parallel beta-helix repeat-containing protein n=1 Tax=Dyadobacter diqingensis TaxID=2938121 RepID=UPI0020C45B54|nr:right-handed parallel beta-helix repeat-containing protein [Dyadobacter diqingensis]